MKRIYLVFASLFLFVGLALAQTRVTGKVVTFEDNEPIIGASVQVVGATNIGTITDVNGQFMLQVPEGKKTLRISYIGKETAEVAASSTPLSIQLRNDENALDEVVVVAYGTQKKTSLTGAIQEVKSEDILLRPTTSVASALEGTVSGVRVNSTYGAPGSNPDIRIRGIGTVNGSSLPLYVVDGVPYNGNISDLNPQDIESMSVLKDAASAALYGNRASNGVILITTKKGKQGKMHVNLDVKYGTYSRGISEYDRLDTRSWMESQWQYMRNYVMTAKGYDAEEAAAYASKNVVNERLYLNIFNKPSDQLFTADGKLVSDAEIIGTYAEDLDWFDQAIHNGRREEYNISVNGGNEKADYLFSVGYLKEKGYLKTSGYDRFSGRAAVNFQPKKWFKTGFNLSASHQTYDSRFGEGDLLYANPFMFCRLMSPVFPVHLHDMNTGEYLLDDMGNKQYDGGYYIDEDGRTRYTRSQFVNRNVLWESSLNQDKTIRNTMNAIAYADFILPYNFTFTVKASLNTCNNSESIYDTAVIGDGNGANGRGSRQENRYKTYTFQQQLAWHQEYGVHSIDALLAHENYQYQKNWMHADKENEVSPNMNNLLNFTQMTYLADYNDTYRTESYLGRVRYGYDNRYNLEASFRRDGSSKFEKDARWGNFWSIGANWVVSNEEFIKKLNWINHLKLRANYGEVGNDAGSSYYAYMALYELYQNANIGALYNCQLPNSDLKWETGQSWGIALDGRLFNKLNFSVEYFDKRNKNLLFDVYNPLSAGATSYNKAESVTTKNLGTISNRGWEISADMDVLKTKDWCINVGADISFIKNKVTKLPEQNKDGIINGTKKIVEGKDRYQFYTYTWEGVNTKNGFSLYKFNDDEYYFTQDNTTYGNAAGKEIKGNNLNTVVVIDGVPYTYVTSYAKREFHGSALPTAFGGFHFTVSWKGLSLYTLFTYQLGGKVYDSNYRFLMNPRSEAMALHQDMMNSWTYEQATPIDAVDKNGTPQLNSSAFIPGTNLTAELNAASSRWLTSASYLILKNINLTYRLPKCLTSKLDIDDAALTLTCENLFTKTARKGMNPQEEYNGTQSNTFVTPRVFSVGLNVKF